MFQVITMWNLVKPDQELRNSISNINLRGYRSDTFLTGEFATKLAGREIRGLSVSDIVYRYCPTGRDIYFLKGRKRLDSKKRRKYGRKFWWNYAGNFVENHIIDTFQSNYTKRNKRNYSGLIKATSSTHKGITNKYTTLLESLKTSEDISDGIDTGDTDWLLTLLNKNTRAEIALKLLHSVLKESSSLSFNNIKFKLTINPKVREIGISRNSEPDFVMEESGIVGDIKTGVKFEDIFQLVCAGYALAFENERKKDINWGIIYFFPTRNPSWLVKPVTFAQIYIFPIDDYLREWFIQLRDGAYNIISKDDPPNFPPEDKRENCKRCRFKEYCISQGLEVDEQ